MLVSVYTPTKNRLELLIKAIDSVLGQTHQDIEMIVINDGSTDGTAAYLEERAQKDHRLRFVNKTISEGAPKARNMAITMAKGEFITGLDDDDAFQPNRVEAFIAYWQLLKNLGLQPACLYSQDIIVKNGIADVGTHKKGSITYRDMIEFNYIGNQIFAPKQYFVEAGLFDEQLPAWQDMDMFIRVLKKFGTAYLLDIPTQLYDDSPRTDRISIKSAMKIRSACNALTSKHAENARHKQQFMLQMFSKFYGIRPTIKDWWIFMKLGVWPKGMATLLRATTRFS